MGKSFRAQADCSRRATRTRPEILRKAGVCARSPCQRPPVHARAMCAHAPRVPSTDRAGQAAEDVRTDRRARAGWVFVRKNSGGTMPAPASSRIADRVDQELASRRTWVEEAFLKNKLDLGDSSCWST